MALIRGMTNSVNGDLLQVQYSLKIFVKHSGLTARGEGACVTVPIRILSDRTKVFAIINSLKSSGIN